MWKVLDQWKFKEGGLVVNVPSFGLPSKTLSLSFLQIAVLGLALWTRNASEAGGIPNPSSHYL